MERKEPADWVFFNITSPNDEFEAIAIYQSKIIDKGSIPYIFSNYRGFQDFNAQGNNIGHIHNEDLKVGTIANGCVVYHGNEISEESIIWEIENGECKTKNVGHLDPHWDDH